MPICGTVDSEHVCKAAGQEVRIKGRPPPVAGAILEGVAL